MSLMEQKVAQYESEVQILRRKMTESEDVRYREISQLIGRNTALENEMNILLSEVSRLKLEQGRVYSNGPSRVGLSTVYRDSSLSSAEYSSRDNSHPTHSNDNHTTTQYHNSYPISLSDANTDRAFSNMQVNRGTSLRSVYSDDSVKSSVANQ
jgi:hypothetical protein